MRVMPHALDRTDHLAGKGRGSCRRPYGGVRRSGGQGRPLHPGRLRLCARLFPFLDLDRMARVGQAVGGLQRHHDPAPRASLRRGRRDGPRADGPHPPLRPRALGDGVVPTGAPGQSTAVPEDAPRAETLVLRGRGGRGRRGLPLPALRLRSVRPKRWRRDGRILLIEDVDEAPHRIDAMLTHLINVGAARAVRGHRGRRDDALGRADRRRHRWSPLARDRAGEDRALGRSGGRRFPLRPRPARDAHPAASDLRARLDAGAGTLDLPIAER